FIAKLRLRAGSCRYATCAHGEELIRVGYAVWEALKIAFTPSLFRSRNYPPTEIPPPAESDTPFPTIQQQQHKPLAVPDELNEAVAEIIFRQAFEAVDQSIYHPTLSSFC